MMDTNGDLSEYAPVRRRRLEVVLYDSNGTFAALPFSKKNSTCPL